MALVLLRQDAAKAAEARATGFEAVLIAGIHVKTAALLLGSPFFC